MPKIIDIKVTMYWKDTEGNERSLHKIVTKEAIKFKGEEQATKDAKMFLKAYVTSAFRGVHFITHTNDLKTAKAKYAIYKKKFKGSKGFPKLTKMYDPYEGCESGYFAEGIVNVKPEKINKVKFKIEQWKI